MMLSLFNIGGFVKIKTDYKAYFDDYHFDLEMSRDFGMKSVICLHSKDLDLSGHAWAIEALKYARARIDVILKDHKEGV